MRKRRIALIVLAAIAALLALNTWLVERETEAADPDIGRILELPGGDVQVREDGDRRDPPLVLVHGFQASLRWWDRVTPALARENRVIRIDLLGHGGSEKPRDGYSMEEQGDLVAQAMEELGVRRAAVVGHSVVGHAISRATPDSAIRQQVDLAFADGTEVPDLLYDDPKRATYNSFSGSRTGNRDYRGEKPLDVRLEGSGIPLDVVVGSEDELADAKGVDEWDLPNLRRVTLKGAGHTPFVERPGQLARIIAEFARRR